MAKNGVYHSARSDINNIRNMLLQGQNQKTSLLFILKEIVQNADDCGSQQLSIGLSEGLSEAKHPLLRSPAILVVNDGLFSKRDDKSIRSIGASAKENDNSAVGKFGIGLKTVFLICEAFFYLKGPKADPEVGSGSMLNLWATDDPDDVPKSDWDELDFETSDQTLMAKERERMGFEDGFTLWFPLRKKDHCQRGQDANPIVAEYPGDDSQFIDEFSDSLLAELVGFLPLLKNLKTIEVYNGKTINCIQVVSESIQCFRDFQNKNISQLSLLTGDIQVNTQQQQQHYFGYQQVLDNVELNTLKNSENWPTLIPDAKGCRKKQKAEQHCAVVLLSRLKTERQGKLLIRWAVFLPTAELPTGGNFEEITLESDEDYILTLHGFFFLGADRRRILDWSESKNGGVLQEWNKILAEQGTLPLLLPTLKDFAKAKSPKIVKELTHKLKGSGLWKNYKNFICSNGSWVYVVRFDDDSENSRWDFIEGKVTIYSIPESNHLIEVLPGLKFFSKNYVLTYENCPFLSQQEKLAEIPSSNIAKLLQQSYSIAHKICTDSEKIKTLYNFIKKSSNDQEVKQVIKGFIKQALLSSPIHLAPNLSDLLRMIPSEQVLYIPENCPDDLCLVVVALQKNTTCLIVPDYLKTNNDIKPPQLLINDAKIILQKLSEFANGGFAFIEAYALDVIKYSKERISLLKEIKLLPLFRIQIINQVNKYKLIALNDLQNYLNQRRLFSDNSHSFAKILAQATVREIYLAKSSIGNYLDISRNLPSCCAEEAILLLNQKLPLKSINERKELLTELLKNLDSSREINKQAIRYLLHGESKHFSSKDALYVGDSSSSIWYRVLQHLIGTEQKWRFISSELSSLINDKQKTSLIINKVNEFSIEQELKKNNDLTSIDWSEFSVEDREYLIQKLEEGLTKKLCIHENIDSSSKLVAIDEHTYLEGGFEINPKLVHELEIVLIRRSQQDYVAYCQKKLSPPVTAKILVEKYLLRCSNPSQYWQVIMDCLEDDPDICSQQNDLSQTKWLPSVSGTAYKPDDIIHLEKIQDDIQRIAANCDRIYITSQELSSDLKNHPGFEKNLCKRLFPKRKKALEMLGLLLEESQEYRVGDFEETIDNQILKDWLTAFKELSIMPVASLLSSFDEGDALVIFNELKKTLNKDELIKIINTLADRHEQATGNFKKPLWKTFCLYLKQAVKHCQWLQILNSIRLFSQADKWQKADKLCYEAPNIDYSYLLDSELQKIIPEDSPENLRFSEDYQQSSNRSELNHASNTAVHKEEQNSDKILINYFDNWPHRTKRAIGILLRILSSDKQTETRILAKQYLPNADAYLEILKPTSIKKNNSSLITKTNNTHFDICLNTQSTTEVTSLIGKPLKAELRQEVNSLIAGNPTYHGDSKVKLTLQKPSIDDSSKLLELVKATFKYIVEKVYYYKVDNIVDFWQKINTLPDIEIVQQKILKSGMINLRNQLKAHQNDCREILEEIEEYFRLDDQLIELARVNTSELRVKDINKQLGDIRKEIGQLLINNENSQAAFLRSVKQNIEQASYDHQSIPFELFQNADDACWQLYKTGKEAVSDEFVLGFDGESIWICHWGRRINQYEFERNDSSQSNSSYKDDILNMLLLNFSHKTDGVTGKFGLGFKSTFLLSEKPKVVSGSIGFEVVGGIYPRELTTEEFELVKSYLEKDAENGTVILLPDVSCTEAEQVIKEFRNCVPLLGAFSKWIKRFTLPNNETWVWDKQSIQGVSNAYYGSSKNGEFLLEGLLLGEEEECCFLQLSPSGVKLLSSDFPTFWVTAPTRMKLGVGFAVNAPFHLDVGRSQLDLRGGGKTENQNITKRLGHQLGKALIKLYNHNEQELRHHLHLAADTTPLIFWTSVWDVLGVQFAQKHLEEEGIKLLRQMLWGEDGGITQFYQECDALPTGLPNTVEAFNGLTRPEKVRWYVTGILDKDASILQKILKWLSCQQIERNQLISSKVAQTLKKLTGKQIESLGLVTLLKWEVGDTNKLNPEYAIRIGDLIKQDFINRLEQEEKSHIIEELIKVKFQAKDGKWYLASQLLVEENNSDESLIVKFAPSSAIIDESYQSTALSLFYVCQQEKIIPVSTLVQWIRQAEGVKRDYVLRYLIEGERRDEIIKFLQSQLPNWTAEIKNQTQQEQLIDRGFKKYHLQGLLDSLGLLNDKNFQPDFQLIEEFDNDADNENQAPPSPLKTPEQLLRQIFDWWQKSRDDLIKKYENSIYPSNDWKLTKTNYNMQKTLTTKAWLTLLLLGTCHSMGRTNPEQHRDFLNHCEKSGWFKVIEAREIKATDWFKLLEDYFSNIQKGERLKYYQWVRHYPAVYVFARWWEAYRDSLLSTNEMSNKNSRNWDIDILFSPRKNQFLQGSGTGNDAPTLSKILGIGQIFVIRELLRAGILINSAMHPYAYVPVRRVRGILQAIGCQGIRQGGEDRNVANSEQIYNFLVKHLGKEDATFCGDYDLPFLMLEQEPNDRKKEILGDIPIISEQPSEDDVVGVWASEKKSSEDGEWRTRWDGKKFKIKA